MLEAFGEVSSSFKTFIDEKKITLFKIYGSQVDLDDRVQRMTLLRTGNIQQFLSEDLVFFMFILKITRKIELRINLPAQNTFINKQVYFMILPQCFFLEDKVKEEFMEHVDLEGRKIDFVKHIDTFILEMESNYKIKNNNYLFYLITKNDTFSKLKIVLWLIGFAINCFCLYTYELNNKTNKGDRRLENEYELYIDIASGVFGGVSGICFLLWLCFRFPAEKNANIMRHNVRHPFNKTTSSYYTKFKVILVNSFLLEQDASNFFMHTIFNILGIFVNPFFYTLNLLLIININQTLRYVVEATIKHID